MLEEPYTGKLYLRFRGGAGSHESAYPITLHERMAAFILKLRSQSVPMPYSQLAVELKKQFGVDIHPGSVKIEALCRVWLDDVNEKKVSK